MKEKRYIVLTIIITIYFLIMAIYFGRDLLAAGHYWRFWLTVGAEALCIVAMFFALRAKQRAAKRRKDEEEMITNKPKVE